MPDTVRNCCDTQAKLPNCACQEPAPITPCSLLVVCGIEYVGVEEAWKATGILPHKLRHLAGRPDHLQIYWA